MRINTSLLFQLLLLFSIAGCTSNVQHNDQLTDDPNDDTLAAQVLEEDSVKVRSVDSSHTPFKVLVVQCSNGYNYGHQGYDLNPVIENALKQFETIEVIPFPLKTLVGVPYQGVFDRKYCAPIIEKVDADFLILTQFKGGLNVGLSSPPPKWGYATKIVETKTLNQINSLEVDGLNSYNELVDFFKNNIEKVKLDIETFQENSEPH